jgi:hypothetical protein
VNKRQKNKVVNASAPILTSIIANKNLTREPHTALKMQPHKWISQRPQKHLKVNHHMIATYGTSILLRTKEHINSHFQILHIYWHCRYPSCFGKRVVVSYWLLQTTRRDE